MWQKTKIELKMLATVIIYFFYYNQLIKDYNTIKYARNIVK